MIKERKLWGTLAALAIVIVGLWAIFQSSVFQEKEAFAANQAEATTAPSEAMRMVQVSGQGEIAVDPDVAYVSLGIQTKADTAALAQANNAAAFAQLEKVLYNDYRINKADVKTVQFRIQPQYVYIEKEGQKLTGYMAVHVVQVTYRDLANLGKLLDAASKAGVNDVSQIEFGTEKSDQYELEALKKAMANAKDKAEVIARSANRTLLDVINVVQSGSVGPAPVNYEAETVRKMMMDSASSTSIATGQVKVIANVSVQYRF